MDQGVQTPAMTGASAGHAGATSPSLDSSGFVVEIDFVDFSHHFPTVIMAAGTADVVRAALADLP